MMILSKYLYTKKCLSAIVKALVMSLTIIIISLLLVPTISAKSSDVFIDYLTDLMWKDCKGNDIHINQPILIDTSTNQSISLITWPNYDKESFRRMIELLDSCPYMDYLGPCGGPHVECGWDGCDILTCGNKNLTIDYDTYYWNGKKVDVPKEELLAIASGNNNTQVINKGDASSINIGDSNTANTGDNNSITHQNLDISFAKGTILGAIIGILLKFLYDILSRKYLK